MKRYFPISKIEHSSQILVQLLREIFNKLPILNFFRSNLNSDQKKIIYVKPKPYKNKSNIIQMHQLCKNIMSLSKNTFLLPFVKYLLTLIQRVILIFEFPSVKEFIKLVINNNLIFVYSDLMNFVAPWSVRYMPANYSLRTRTKCMLYTMFSCVLQLGKTSSDRYHTEHKQHQIIH